jgi:hypothetical protein
VATTPGLGGGGSVGVAFETVMGTYVPPTIYVPIISESLEYTEEKYLSEQIRQQSIHTEAKPSYYHVEGDIEMEVDPELIVYFLYAGRHTVTKTGAATPWTYKFIPNSAGSASTAAGPTTQKTLSITVVRNGEVFGYAGCALGGFEFSIDTDSGILMATLNMMGLSESSQTDPTEAWVAPKLYGADAHILKLDSAGIAPTFAAAADVNHNGITFGVNFNAEAQNRIRNDRAASYITFGITEGTVSAEIDFLTRTDYDFFKATNKRAIRVGSYTGGVTLAAAAHGVELQANNYFFNTYSVPLSGMGDLIAAETEGRMLGISGGDAYSVSVKTIVTNIV